MAGTSGKRRVPGAGTPSFLRGVAGALLSAVLVPFAVLGGSAAWAGHAMNQGNDCYDCHDLSMAVGAGEPGTSYLSASARGIMADIRSANGGTAPSWMGCIYCHNSSVLKDDPDTAGTLLENRMRDASDHFRGHASTHPIGYNLTNMADTKGHLLSSFDANADGVGDRAAELDCIDCHDVTQSENYLGYPQHGKPLATNPFMLRAGAGGFDMAAGEYDGVCRRCHGSATGSPGIASFKGTGLDLRLTVHPDGSDTTTNVMRESDGTLLKVADLNNDGVADANRRNQCTSCHNAHYSASNKKLFASTIDMSNGSRCTDCHFAGDNNNLAEGGNFEKYGHGKAGIDFACTACHGVNSEHDAVTPANGSKMLNFSPDTAVSKYGKSLLSICRTCHNPTRYQQHTGGGGGVGCIDCHDEHAEGSGPTSNRAMIPQRLPNNYASTELSFFQSAGDLVANEWDYYVPDSEDRKVADMGAEPSAGVCDNGVCHAGTVVRGTPISPLSTFMTGASHSGGGQSAGADCTTCHKHTDPAGSWRATAHCDACHADATGTVNTTSLPRTHGNATESPATHARHAASGYVSGCDDCHAHDGKSVAPGTGTHMDGVVNFGGPRMPGAGLDYADMAFGGTCVASNGCHDSEAGEWRGGLASSGDGGCVDCHEAVGKLLGRVPNSGLHAVTNVTRHDAGLLGGQCVNCHDASGPSSAHLDGTLNTPEDATFAFHPNVLAYARGVGCQAAPACHPGGDGGSWRRRWAGVVDAVPGTAGNDTPGQAVCQNCHGDFSGWRWTEGGGTTDHTDPYGGNAGDRMGEHGACQTCHGWGSAAYDRAWRTGRHGNGSLDLNGPDATHGAAAGAQYNDDTGGCMSACHGSQFALSTDSGWPAAYGDFGTGDCSSCHKPGGSGPTVVWPAGDATGRRTAYGSHLGATAAEEGNAFLGGLGGEWKGQCNKCHDLHNGTIKAPAPPASWTDPSGRLAGADMRARLGLTYANETGVALHLGGTAAGGASEAEFCWGCHDGNGVSEWGFNTKTTPTGYPVASFPTLHDGSQESVDLGWIYTAPDHLTKTSDWTQGYWQDEYDALTARRIASVHTANFDPAGQSSSVAANVDAGGVVNRNSPVLEPKGAIRCSNCHDVHDTFGPDGKPYLRGRWTGNPYPPELPPRSTYTYANGVNVYYATPRGRVGAREKGGYFIDQNSGWPTANAAMDTLQETAELCTLCHGTDVDGMDYYTGKKLWRAPMVNGHSNAALGGTGANKVDLFSGTRYPYGMGMQGAVPGPPYVCGFYGGECDGTYPLSWWMNGCCDGQPVVSASGWYGTDFANWYGTGTIGGASGPGSRAHTFTCSKCHSPHASGLPALLPQNCIDPALGTWSINGHTGLNLVANNCHRKTSPGDGWHVLAPGQ